MRRGPPERAPLLYAGAILLGCTLIAFSILYTFRYSVTPVPPRVAAIRYDRWTGDVRWCLGLTDGLPNSLLCEHVTPKDR